MTFSDCRPSFQWLNCNLIYWMNLLIRMKVQSILKMKEWVEWVDSSVYFINGLYRSSLLTISAIHKTTKYYFSVRILKNYRTTTSSLIENMKIFISSKLMSFLRSTLNLILIYVFCVMIFLIFSYFKLRTIKSLKRRKFS